MIWEIMFKAIETGADTIMMPMLCILSEALNESEFDSIEEFAELPDESNSNTDVIAFVIDTFNLLFSCD